MPSQPVYNSAFDSSRGYYAQNANVVGVHYRSGPKIGEGSFGVIYSGVNLLNNQAVAIKFESRKAEAPQLRDEFRTYKIMAGTVGIPNVYYYGQEGLHNILVIDLLGPSLEDLFESCGRKFSIKTTCLLARQMITRIQALHEKSLIYRDIKPDNYLIGRIGTKHQNTVWVVDFGMAKHYRDPRTKQHIPYRERKSISGTARYMSINTHLGREQSRRDDLEALGHVFMYFLRGGLPWQGLKAANNKQKYEKIGEKKQTTAIHELCDGFPEEFANYMTYVRNLRFEETPDYEMLKGLFDKVLKKIGEVDDGVYDWMTLESWLAAQPSSAPATPTSGQHHGHHQVQDGRLLPGPSNGAVGQGMRNHKHHSTGDVNLRAAAASTGGQYHDIPASHTHSQRSSRNPVNPSASLARRSGGSNAMKPGVSNPSLAAQQQLGMPPTKKDSVVMGLAAPTSPLNPYGTVNSTAAPLVSHNVITQPASANPARQTTHMVGPTASSPIPRPGHQSMAVNHYATAGNGLGSPGSPVVEGEKKKKKNVFKKILRGLTKK